MIMRVTPVLMPLVDVCRLCQRPYEGHPRGCPNFGKRDTCPPEAGMFAYEFYGDEVYAICVKFQFGYHVKTMRKKHPDWSERQLRCCLYWQGTARKMLREEIARFILDHPDFTVTACPEAMGVDVTATMQQAGIHLEWPPEVLTHHVALGARLRKSNPLS